MKTGYENKTLENWLLNKLSVYEVEAFRTGEIVRETEKAILFQKEFKGQGYIGNGRFDDDKMVQVWITKSAIIDFPEEVEEEVKQGRDELIEILKQAGAKVTKRSKSATLRTKANELGIDISNFDLRFNPAPNGVFTI